jgi:signal transduction histidine kinase
MTAPGPDRPVWRLWLGLFATAVAAAWLTPEPHKALAIGIVLALVLGLLALELRRSYLLARALSEGNRTLAASAEELRRLNEILEARVEERTAELETMTHSFSHDLKSPLGAILNFSTILVEDHREQLDTDGLEIVARIRRSAMRATALLDGLLRLDRARRAPLEAQEIDMTALARQAFAQVQATSGDRDVELVLETLPNASGDRLLIAELLANLFDNSIKFSRGRPDRRVTVRGRASDSECQYEVADNGTGFDMQYVEKLFGVFERLHTSTDLPGTGVGLALVKKIVQRHGGRVWAVGEPDRGTRVSFTLPSAKHSPARVMS